MTTKDDCRGLARGCGEVRHRVPEGQPRSYLKIYNINVLSFRIRNFVTPIVESVCTLTGAYRPSGTALLVMLSRQFVPGYDRTVAPGRFAQAFARWCDVLRKVCQRVPQGQHRS